MSEPDELQEWLTAGDAPEADWARYVLRRALRGQLGDGGPGILLALPALMQPYACQTGACSPGLRARKSKKLKLKVARATRAL